MRISDWSSDVCSSDLDPLPAARLHELGVISALVGLDQLMPTVRKIAQTINANSRPAISGARRLFQLSADLPLDEALRVGREIGFRSEEHTSDLQSLMRISYAVFCLKKKKTKAYTTHTS